MRLPGVDTYCMRNPVMNKAGGCLPPSSATTYLFPSTMPSDKCALRFDGAGDRLLKLNTSLVAMKLLQEGAASWFFSENFTGAHGRSMGPRIGRYSNLELEAPTASLVWVVLEYCIRMLCRVCVSVCRVPPTFPFTLFVVCLPAFSYLSRSLARYSRLIEKF